MYDQNNVFAKILRGELPAKKIFEDDFALSFHDISGGAQVHALVVPKGPFTDIYDFVARASQPEQLGFWAAVKSTADALGLREFRTIANTGPSAEQTIFHFHLHLIAH